MRSCGYLLQRMWEAVNCVRFKPFTMSRQALGQVTLRDYRTGMALDATYLKSLLSSGCSAVCTAEAGTVSSELSSH